MGKEWYVLRVQAGKEERVRDTLDKKLKVAGLDHFVGNLLIPTKKETTIKDGKAHHRDVKIFPGYIYIEADLYNGQDLRDEVYYLVKETPSVGDFTGPIGRPAAMSPEDVEKIFNRMTTKPAEAAAGATATAGAGTAGATAAAAAGAGTSPTGSSAATTAGASGRNAALPPPDTTLPFSKGDRVKIRDGHAFGGFEGTIEEIHLDRGQVKVIVTIFGRPTEVELAYNQIEPVA